MNGEGDGRVAVVMITYNRVNEVLRTLDEVTRLPERPRVFVVDNGSTDGTIAAVTTHFPHVEVVALGRNLGASARTVGVRSVSEPYVAFSDDDSWWEPGSLRRAVELFEAQPRLALMTGRVLVGPHNVEDPICNELARSPLPREDGMPGPPLLGFLAGATVVRRSAFLEAGGFEPRFFIGGEEELLAADLAARGYWLCYVPELVVHHHPSRLRDHNTRRASQVRNALWFAWLRRPASSVSRMMVRLVCEHPWDRALVRGFAEALWGLPWALSQRRVVPPEIESRLMMLEARR